MSALRRAATVRPDATYEMDTAEAEIFDEADAERGRPGRTTSRSLRLGDALRRT